MAITLVMAVVTVGCSDVDSNLGANFLPDGNDMTVGQLDLKGVNRNGARTISSRLFSTTKINSATQSYGAIGIENNEEFGLRRSGLFAQYTPTGKIDPDEKFGYKPFIDSMVIFLGVDKISGDSTYVCTYEVYEVVDDSFLVNSDDSLFSVDYDIMASGALNPEPLFEFVYPDQANGVYTNESLAMSVNMSESGVALGDRLLLKGDDLDHRVYNGDYEKFVENFKGLYIIPKESYVAPGEGATYTLTMSLSGFGFTGRNLYEEDPTIVSDTIRMSYNFRDDAIDVGGVSIQSVFRDYSTAGFDSSLVKSESNPTVEYTNRIRVEGLGGVVSEIVFERGLFEELDQALVDGGDEYTNIFINNAYLRVYAEMAQGNNIFVDEEIFSADDIKKMALYPSRLGLYNTYATYLDEDNYSMLEGVEDYDYYNEIVYGVTSNFNGFFNRTQGCYQMYIPLQLQNMWNKYLVAKEQAGGDIDAIDWEGATWNKTYLAPVADDLFSPRYVTLQGGAGFDNAEGTETKAPIRLGITYTLLKR